MQTAIEQGLNILSWYENHTKDEMPPEHIWEDPQGLKDHFEKVRAKWGVGGGQAAEGTDMVENEYAAEFKR